MGVVAMFQGMARVVERREDWVKMPSQAEKER
jgi:hypothetical protein